MFDLGNRPSQLAVLALLAVLGCVAPQIRKDCVPSCENGQTCDPRYGMCREDPCHGSCAPGERCRPGPPPSCSKLSMGEVDQNGTILIAPGSEHP
jgi:hypothetical protein